MITTMNRLQEYLARAGNDLGIQVIAPFEITVGAGKRLLAEALLPQLGASKGMLVVRSYDDIQNISNEVTKLGYGYSVLDEPLPNEDYDLESYEEMFTDWGWASESKTRPDWMQ